MLDNTHGKDSGAWAGAEACCTDTTMALVYLTLTQTLMC